MNESWSIGFIIGVPIAVLLLLFFLAGIKWGGDSEGRFGAGVLAVACVAWLFLPWGLFVTGGTDYHKFKPKSGEVAEIGHRQVSKGKGMEEKFVIRFKDGAQEYGVSDTRAGLVKVGDIVTIKCKRSYQFASESGYDCRWVSRIPKGA
jgi:hypothetical protein